MPDDVIAAPTTLPKAVLGVTKPANVRRVATPPAAPPPAPSAALPDIELDPLAVPVPPQAPVTFPALDAVPAPARPRPADASVDPYEPLGIRAGAFLLRPSIEVDFGYDTNPGQQPGKVKGATYTMVTPRIDFASDWSRHELKGSIDAGLTHYFGIEDANRPRLDAIVGGRLDVRRDTAVEGEVRLNLDTERIGSDGVPTTASKRPLTTQYGGTLGVVQHFGDASVSLRGSIDRNEYEEVTPGEQRDYSTYGLALRGTYDLSPAVRPFAEISGDTRRYDGAASLSTSRDSQGAYARAGSVFEFTGKLTGEASLGYGGRNYDDPTLRNIGGILANASLVWTASALTTVTLRASTDFSETTVAGATGYITRIAGIEVRHAFRRNLIATATASLTRDVYDGVSRTDDTYDAGLGIEYRLSRSVAIRANYAYERLASTVPGTDYTANSIMVGLKVQP